MVTETLAASPQTTAHHPSDESTLAADLLLVSLGIEVLLRMGLSTTWGSRPKTAHGDVRKPIPGVVPGAR